MEVKGIEVRNSKIEGSGVFATKNFKKGEIVLKWDLSHQLSQKEYLNLPKSEKKCVVFGNNKYYLMQKPFRYVNHSCNSNTKVENFCDIAIKNIKKGEEITSDYNDDAPPEGEVIECNCGAENCKGFLKT